MHALLVFCAISLSLGALLSNWAYWTTEQIQWTNFASWLTAGALVFTGVALVWALVERALRRNRHGAPPLLYLLGLTACCAVGLLSSLVLAKDGWAAMPAALWLSVLAVLLVTVTGGLGAVGLRRRVAP
ncbi:DUF2231 domain-containing protein [Ramlibacter sp.]|uniref:DUF2231 domain-containing protein n=1 Tax=Ramlibacter sp. TaxID=1917967 RepID=UPI003D124B4E